LREGALALAGGRRRNVWSSSSRCSSERRAVVVQEHDDLGHDANVRLVVVLRSLVEWLGRGLNERGPRKKREEDAEN